MNETGKNYFILWNFSKIGKWYWRRHCTKSFEDPNGSKTCGKLLLTMDWRHDTVVLMELIPIRAILLEYSVISFNSMSEEWLGMGKCSSWLCWSLYYTGVQLTRTKHGFPYVSSSSSTDNKLFCLSLSSLYHLSFPFSHHHHISIFLNYCFPFFFPFYHFPSPTVSRPFFCGTLRVLWLVVDWQVGRDPTHHETTLAFLSYCQVVEDANMALRYDDK